MESVSNVKKINCHLLLDEKVKAGTLLKCLECQSINEKTIPEKLAYSPMFIAGEVFSFEKSLIIMNQR